MKSKFLSSLLPLLLAPILAIACGGSADDPPPAPANGTTNTTEPTTPAATASTPATGAAACEAAGNAICARACACATDGKCHVGVDVGMGDTAASVNFDNETKCRDFYVTLGCYNGGEPGFDYGTCRTKVEAGACIDSASGLAGQYPSECRVTKK